MALCVCNCVWGEVAGVAAPFLALKGIEERG